MTGSSGSGGSAGSLLPKTSNTEEEGDYYGLPGRIPGLSFHEKTLLGLMGWWMAINILGIFYALFAIDFGGDGIFQSETVTTLFQKVSAAILRIISLGVVGSRPRPHGSIDNPAMEGGGSSFKKTASVNFFVALLAFLFLGILFPSNITAASESFMDLGSLPNFFGKNKNKPGDILGNAANISSKVMASNTTSTLTKEHDKILDTIRNRSIKFKKGAQKWETKFNNVGNTTYSLKSEEWQGWRKKM